TRCDLRASHLPRLHCFDLLPASTSMHRIALHCTGARRHKRRCVALMIPDFLHPPVLEFFFFLLSLCHCKKKKWFALVFRRLLCPLECLFHVRRRIFPLLSRRLGKGPVSNLLASLFLLYIGKGVRLLPHQEPPPRATPVKTTQQRAAET